MSINHEPFNWYDLINDNFLDTSKKFYQNHCDQNLPCYDYIKSVPIDLDLFPTGEIQPVWDSNLHDVGKKLNIHEQNQSLLVNKYNEPSEQCEHVSNSLKLRHCHVACNVQLPNNVVGIHVDMNRSFTHFCKTNNIDLNSHNIKKYVIFLDDWEIGQTFMLGHQTYTNWKQFDCISWPWYMPHGTCNASTKDRKILFIVGI